MESTNKNYPVDELDAPIYRDPSQRSWEAVNFCLARGRYLQSAFAVDLLSRLWQRLISGLTARAGGCTAEYGLQGELAGHPLKVRANLES